MKAMIIHIVKKFKEEDRELMIKNILKNHKKKLIKFELNQTIHRINKKTKKNISLYQWPKG